ncbi:hypothetical protein PT974_02881 [Cladobotryum mycophilum]|uniref:Uncharacterized protein n=1 Tax=Cladobotryum mycophilum TaxID=491253 RepID=A0ABR0SZH5_9HYPO
MSSNSLPRHPSDHGPSHGSADPRTRLLPHPSFSLEPYSSTRSGSYKATYAFWLRELGELREEIRLVCEETPHTQQEARLAREEVRLAREEIRMTREETRLIRQEARLAQARAQKEIQEVARQLREEMHIMCAEIEAIRVNHFSLSVDSNSEAHMSSQPLPPYASPITPRAMVVDQVQADLERSG